MWSAAGCSRPVQTAAPCWQYCRWCQMKTASPLQIFVECWFWWDNNSCYRSNNLLRDETIVRLLFVCFLFALFFLPHTWNVALTHGGQYSNQLILRCTKVRWRIGWRVSDTSSQRFRVWEHCEGLLLEIALSLWEDKQKKWAESFSSIFSSPLHSLWSVFGPEAQEGVFQRAQQHAGGMGEAAHISSIHSWFGRAGCDNR